MMEYPRFIFNNIIIETIPRFHGLPSALTASSFTSFNRYRQPSVAIEEKDSISSFDNLSEMGVKLDIVLRRKAFFDDL